MKIPTEESKGYIGNFEFSRHKIDQAVYRNQLLSQWKLNYA